MARPAIDLKVARRAVSAAQAILREQSPNMVVDGKPGTFTIQVYRNSPAVLKQAVDDVVTALGVTGTLERLHTEYTDVKAATREAPTADSSKQQIFDLQVVPALTREARRRGLPPVHFITQAALETGYGKSTPLRENGQPTYNYGGIKWEAVKTPEKAYAKTKEQTKAGKEYEIKDAFAVFASPSDFATQYFSYLFNGPSSYRYKKGYKGISPGIENAKDPYSFGSALQIGGYATDVNYATKFANSAASVARKYALA